jgi:hypothetical protein
MNCLTDIECKGLDWICLAQDWDHWRGLANIVQFIIRKGSKSTEINCTLK